MRSEREGGAPPWGPPDELPELLGRLQKIDRHERRRHLFRYVHQRVGRALGLEGSLAADPHKPLTEQGLTSIRAVELAEELGNAIGRTLSPTVMFNYPTIDATVGYLARELSLEEPETGNQRPAQNRGEEGLLDEVAELSEQELEAYVGAELEKLLE